MKKLVTLALSVMVLAAFTGLSAVKASKVESIPPASMVKLSVAQNVASSIGCVVNARPMYTENSNHIYKNFPVHFQKLANNDWVDLTPNPMRKTNSQGVAPRSIPWNTTIRVWIAKPNGQKAYSNEFTCSSPNG